MTTHVKELAQQTIDKLSESEVVELLEFLSDYLQEKHMKRLSGI